MKKSALLTILASAIIASLPFYYLISSDGFRYLLYVVPALALLIVMGPPAFRMVAHGWVFLLVLGVMLLLAAMGGNFNVLFAAALFFLLAYWPIFVSPATLRRLNVERLTDVYIWTAAFFAVGLIVQYTLFHVTGYKFGKLDQMYQRTGFAFLWTDYSFASLFLASGFLLLVSSRQRRLLKISLGALIGAGMIITTARTGIAALGMLIAYNVLRDATRAVTTLKISRTLLAQVVGVIVSAPLFIFAMSKLSDREVGLESSARVDSYRDAFQYWSEHPMTGIKLDIDTYQTIYKFIPHNLILYLLAAGGLLLFAVCVIWMVLLYLDLRRAGPRWVSVMLLCFFGLQFIPSVFSAYFLATLIAIALVKVAQAPKVAKTNVVRGHAHAPQYRPYAP